MQIKRTSSPFYWFVRWALLFFRVCLENLLKFVPSLQCRIICIYNGFMVIPCTAFEKKIELPFSTVSYLMFYPTVFMHYFWLNCFELLKLKRPALKYHVAIKRTCAVTMKWCPGCVFKYTMFKVAHSFLITEYS